MSDAQAESNSNEGGAAKAVSFTTRGYQLPTYSFVAPPDLNGREIRRYPVVIVGAGLAGLAAACDFASRSITAVVLDEDDTIGVRGASSRGIVYAQKTLEIFARLGLYERVRDKGVVWSKGKTLAGMDVVYEFDMASATLSQQPPFINLQQFYVEWFLVDRITEIGITDLRWKSRVTKAEQRSDCVRLSVDTPLGGYQLDADWVIDAAGLHSVIRDGFGLSPNVAGKTPDRWCIADVRFKKPLPVERWTWVEAPFNENRAVWQHLMADGVWRMDFQMAADADPEYVSRPDVAAARIRAQIGDEVEFELVWVGPYAYRSHLMERFRHGRVFFIGDAAHVMSPFGARGGNSGIQDADNLVWKLALVMAGRAPEALLDSFNVERRAAAELNIAVTNGTARFLAPRSEYERTQRRAAISLAREYRFARGLVNTGRLSQPSTYPNSPIVAHGGHAVQNAAVVLPDGKPGCLVDLFKGPGVRMIGVWFAPRDGDAQLDQRDAYDALNALRGLADDFPFQLISCGADRPGVPCIGDIHGKLAQALDTPAGALVLIRPDLHVAGVLRCEPRQIHEEARSLLRRALGFGAALCVDQAATV